MSSYLAVAVCGFLVGDPVGPLLVAVDKVFNVPLHFVRLGVAGVHASLTSCFVFCFYRSARYKREIAIDSSPPLYSAADRPGLDDRGFFVVQGRVESIPEEVVLYRLGIVVVVVDGAVVE